MPSITVSTDYNHLSLLWCRTQIDSRIEEISGIASEIESIEVVTEEHDVFRNTKINIILRTESMINTINAFGRVLSGVVPVLLSLTDNKHGLISVKWKLNGTVSEINDDVNSKLRVEWSEAKSDDLTEFDEKWEHQKEVNLIGKLSETTTTVSVKNKVAVYVMRIHYFDGTDWWIPSEMKTVSIEKVFDAWDPQCKGTDLVISGTSIMHSSNWGIQRAYCKNVVSEGIHSWTFRIDQISSGRGFLLGVFKSQDDPVVHTGFQSNPTGSYSLDLHDGWLFSLTRSGHMTEDSNKRNYGAKCKSGDVIKMTLDLVSCTLSYAVNGRDYGKAWDVENSSYRAACTIYANSDKITLSVRR